MDIVTDKNTVTEIKSWLDSHGIEYPSNAQKADLLKLVPGEPQEDIDQAESEATIVGQSEATSSVADSASFASDSSSMASSSAAVDVQPAQPDSSSSAVQPEAPVESVPVDPNRSRQKYQLRRLNRRYQLLQKTGQVSSCLSQ